MAGALSGQTQNNVVVGPIGEAVVATHPGESVTKENKSGKALVCTAATTEPTDFVTARLCSAGYDG